ncbi:MAG: hypothetical protein RL513_1400 [Pseudomonadota bacterium]
MNTPEAAGSRSPLKGAHLAARQSRFRECSRTGNSLDFEHA